MPFTPDVTTVLDALKKPRAEAQPVIHPPDTGDDMVVPPDPGYMGPINSIYQQAGGQSQMPFPNNHNPNMDFVNRWPVQLPPAGIMNDLRPKIETGPELVRKLLTNG